jgi:hypothetical protein
MTKAVGVVLLVPVGWLISKAIDLGSGWSIALVIAACLIFLLSTMLILGRDVALSDGAVLITGAMLAGALQWLDASESGVAKFFILVLAYITWIAFSYFLFGTPMILVPFPPFFIFTWRQLTAGQQKAMWLRLLSLASLIFVIYIAVQMSQ